MKKTWLWCLAAALVLSGAVRAQEMLEGGNMEDEAAWTVYDMGSNDLSEYQFNYTTDVPAAGSGGCLYVTATSGYSNILFWQPVVLEGGVTYEIGGAFKELTGTLGGNWVQIYIAEEEPVEGADWKPNAGSNSERYVGFNSWTNADWGLIDGTFQVDGLELDDGKKTKFYTAPGAAGEEVTVFFGLKMGVWANAPIWYEVLVDELSLKRAAEGYGAPEFPPAAVTGPFPFGTEPVRDDSPVDAARPGDIVHEYTAYKVADPPVIDGDIETDPVWTAIPWTPMTWWENGGYTEEFSVFDGATSDLWDGFLDCTAWWKMLWDDGNVYLALEIVDDQYNAPETPESPGNMHNRDCVQFGLHATPPGVDEPIEGDPGCELGFGITDFTGPWEEMFAIWNYSGHPWAPSEMQLAAGDNASGNASTEGKAIHASVEELADHYVYRYEIALAIDDLWAPYITDDAVGRVTLMAMDHDTDTYEDVNWGSGILTKDFTRLASVLWSASAPTAVRNEPAARPEAFVLSQNYPNPFNPLTEFAYTLARPENVTVSIYTLSGREVMRPLDGARMAAGQHRVTLDASSLPSGVYVYSVKAGSAAVSRKMTLIK